MLYINLNLINTLLQDLGLLTKSSIQLYNNEFEGTYACTAPGNPFCQQIKKHLIENCFESDTIHMMECQKCTNKCMNYHCHFGLKEMLFKLEHNKTIYGYIMVGPFRDLYNQIQMEEKIKKYAVEYNIDEKLLLNNYNQIPSFTNEKFESIKNLINIIFEYSLTNNILSLNKDIFELQINPYIKNNIGSKLEINELCSFFNLTEKQLYSIIIKATGLSPKKYITQQKMNAAINMLITTNMSPVIIAEKVGFDDYTYFGKVFKSVTTHTPSHYRKKRNKDDHLPF